MLFFFFNDTATTEIYTLSLHDALPISACTNANPAIQAQISGLEKAAVVTGAGSNVALNGDLNQNSDGSRVPLASVLGFPFPPTFTQPAPFFAIPVACPSAGAQVNQVMCGSNNTGVVPLPASFVPMNSLRGNFPVMEKTSLWSARLDQRWSNHNASFLRVGVS